MNVTATFTVTQYAITVQLLNLEVNPGTVDQAIGSLRFTVAGGTAPTPISETFSGTEFTIASNGSPANVNNVTNEVWTTPSPGVAFCVVCGVVGNRAMNLVIGGPDGKDNSDTEKYAASLQTASGASWIIASNISYNGNSPFHIHNLDTSPTWVLNFGVDVSQVLITSATFGFGDATSLSGPGEYGSAFLTVTPEPDTLILFGTGIGLVAIAVVTRRFRRS